MNLFEYQAKTLLARYGVPVPAGAPIASVQEVDAALARVPVGPWMVKAQVASGGRGKAGGIKRAATPVEVRDVVQQLLGRTLVTRQTGPAGVIVHRLLLEEAQPVEQELYVAVTMDRRRACPLLLASTQGGMEIEELARVRPDAIIQEAIDPWRRLQPIQARRLAQALGFKASLLTQAADLIQRVVTVFFEWDCSLLEINPLVVVKSSTEGHVTPRLLALDAKVTLDDNGAFRHPEFQTLQDELELDASERQAVQAGVSYIRLSGAIGCLVNGAGLAMATMDLIKHHGGEPANFLDVGGGASIKQVTEAFQILCSDPQVKAVLVNIFGGIMRCDVIAEGIRAALAERPLRVPMVVRLEGTRVEEGRAILQRSGLSLISANDLTEAAEQVVKAAKAAGT
ncbi:MAG: ADP-forming succinate--CoA ligase subunit beta [Elusimicrobia bacterium]|nr:ADP-forming succinate--CoA ligase subunit beta [Elusimicrobiota bacterium]